jgi:hypothetical protein
MHATRSMNVCMVLAIVMHRWTASKVILQAYSMRQTGTETQAAKLQTNSNALGQLVLQQP